MGRMQVTRENGGGWRWTIDEDAAALQPRWQDLAARTGRSALAGPAWTYCFSHAFTPGGQIHLHALYDGDSLAAVLPLQLQRGFVRRWAAPRHPHQPVWTCAVDVTRTGIAEEIVAHLLTSADAIDLALLSGHDAIGSALRGAAHAQVLDVTVEERHCEAIIDLSPPWPAFCSTLPEGLSRHLQKLRQLERLGTVEFAELRDEDALDDTLTDCFAVEAAGWKGARGSAMQSHIATRRFYSTLVRAAAREGSLALYTLRLNRVLIAFELCLKSNARVDALKISYAPTMARYSPGNVLRTLVLRKEVEGGRMRIHHLGLDSDWKRRWSTRVEPLYRLAICRRSLRARLMYRVWPRLREPLRRSPLLRAAARRARVAAAWAEGPASRAGVFVRRTGGRVLQRVRWVAHHQSLVILRKTYAEPPRSATRFACEQIDDPDAVIQVYRALGRETPDTVLRRRCAAGLRFAVLRDRGDVIATAFVVPCGERFVDECALGFALPQGSLWLRDVYVVPERRGERLFGVLLDAVVARSFPGTREVLSDVRSHDERSLHAHAVYGFEPIGMVESLHFGQRLMFRRSSVRYPNPASTFAPGRRLFPTGATYRRFVAAHLA